MLQILHMEHRLQHHGRGAFVRCDKQLCLQAQLDKLFAALWPRSARTPLTRHTEEMRPFPFPGVCSSYSLSPAIRAGRPLL